MTTQHSVANHA